MQIMKKYQARAAALAAFGPFNTWGRAEHLAYGLVRGVAYSRMEKCSNDNPHAFPLGHKLRELGAWPEHVVANDGKFHSLSKECYDEVQALVVWVRKEPRVRRPHIAGTRSCVLQEAAQ